MNCAEFETRLDTNFEPNGLPEDAELNEHAANCPPCRATLNRMRLLSDAIPAWRAQTADVELSIGVLVATVGTVTTDVSATTRPATARSNNRPQPVDSPHFNVPRRTIAAGATPETLPRSRHSLFMVTAVLVAVISLFSVQISSPPDRSPSAPVAVDNSQDMRTIDKADSPPNIAPDRSTAVTPNNEMPPAYVGLAKLVSGAWDEVTLLVHPDSKPPRPTETETKTASPAGWFDDFQHRLKPVGRSLDNTFDFLWQAGRSTDG